MLTGMYAAEARYLATGGPGVASFDELAPFFDEEVVLHQAEALPYGGTWHGHAGMERFFVAMSRTWDIFDMVAQRILSTGDPLVVHTEVSARSRATGRRITFPILQTLTVHNGRITEVYPFYWDTAMITAACTP
ncbi:nuclear transport factor 2 family protein [Amycolatopsis minnesotensis]|uniref:Nuclear transport factor 2 family protein n=1 Tax=Amycolatopsis minnesotensis TaxID=337894 RepID=A0ABN2RFF1_9PSEU